MSPRTRRVLAGLAVYTLLTAVVFLPALVMRAIEATAIAPAHKGFGVDPSVGSAMLYYTGPSVLGGSASLLGRMRARTPGSMP